MTSQRWSRLIVVAGLGIAAAGHRTALGQIGAARYPSLPFGAGAGSGVSYSGLGNLGVNPTSGYNINTGQIRAGYGSAYGLYRRAYVPPARTTIALQPLYSAITSLPGWDGPTRRVRHRAGYVRSARHDPPIPHYDRNGRILWPGLIRDDPSTAGLRQSAETAFEAVYHESRTTGHASIRPVIDAKARLSAYERKILPGIKSRSVPDGDFLERFFVDLDRSLDQMNAAYF